MKKENSDRRNNMSEENSDRRNNMSEGNSSRRNNMSEGNSSRRNNMSEGNSSRRNNMSGLEDLNKSIIVDVYKKCEGYFLSILRRNFILILFVFFAALYFSLFRLHYVDGVSSKEISSWFEVKSIYAIQLSCVALSFLTLLYGFIFILVHAVYFIFWAFSPEEK